MSAKKQKSDHLGFSIADAGEGPLPLHPIPKNADFHTPEKIVLLCKSYVGISAV